MKTVLTSEFFSGNVLDIAPALLGKALCIRKQSGVVINYHIIEVEAYDGIEDKACHANRKITPRTAVLFGPPGCWYVYLCYGIHWMLNVVTGPENYPAAVLIRGVIDFIGPGRLTKGLGIDKTYNNRTANFETGLWIEDHGIKIKTIKRTPRIGIDYAGPSWSKKLYRFVGTLTK